ncbi:LacI family DNA-binding transcriptional regulator [Arthrobacter alpinus]|nr:LacI family DNA-binding transcriptional regulator [Arthrobacter alpinus]
MSALPSTNADGETRATAKKPATIHDVAALSGVAASTVSRALSTPGRVNFRTRARIEAAATELKYVPNAQAKALSSGQTKAVAVLVADITNPFYFDIIRGTQLQLKAAGYTQFLVDTEESKEVEVNTIEQMMQMADGVILTAPRLNDEALVLAATKMPLVTINREVPGIPSVLLDTPTATNQALDHLISLGHSHIAYLGGPGSSSSNIRRWEALSTAAQERGVQMDRLGPFAPRTYSGDAAADALVYSGATAGIAFNDLMAIGMLQRLAARGVRVPEDISLVGCDDILVPISAVPADHCHCACGASWTRGCHHVAESDQSGRRHTPRSQSVLPTHLTIRGSTGPAPLRP